MSLRMTNPAAMELKFWLDDGQETVELHYSSFSITDDTAYTLSVSGFDADNKYNMMDDFSMGDGTAFYTHDKPDPDDCVNTFGTAGW